MKDYTYLITVFVDNRNQCDLEIFQIRNEDHALYHYLFYKTRKFKTHELHYKCSHIF